MKTMAIKTINIISVLFVLLALCSCTEVLAPGNDEAYNTDTVLVRLSLELSADNGAEFSRVLDSQRTFLPALPATGNFTLKLSNPEKGVYDTTVTLTSASSSAPINLVTGNWEAVVIWNKPGVPAPVVLGSAGFTVSAGANNITLNVIPVSGGTGLFSYTINLSASTVKASATLALQAKGGAQYVRTLEINAGTSSSGTILDLPSGDYDVFVSLLAPDGRSAGAYSAANIYAGLETTGSFAFGTAHFVTNINLAGKASGITVTGGSSVTSWSSATITAYSTIENTPVTQIGTSTIAPGGEWVIRVPYNVPTVYLSLELTGSNGLKYLKKNALVQNMSEVGANGEDNIPLSIAIYTVNSGVPLTSGVNSITPARYTASPGETINLDISSSYGLKTGTIRVFWVSESQYIPVTGSGVSYAFTMPEGNVNLSLFTPNFFTADLVGGAPVVKTGSGASVGLTLLGTDSWKTTADIAYNITAITVTATPLEPETTVTISGNIANLSAGPNPVTITVTPLVSAGGTGISRIYTINVIKAQSPVNTLSSLTVDKGTLTPPFNPNDPVDRDAYPYTVAGVPYGSTSITVGAIPSDNNATVTVNGTAVNSSGTVTVSPLNPGLNTITVTVLAQDGTGKNYKINITPESNNNTNLTDIKIDDVPIPGFNAGNTFYPVSVSYDTHSITVEAVPSDNNATVTINGTKPLGGGVPVSLGFGPTTITVKVTAENGVDTKNYIVYVTRPEPDESDFLVNISLTNGGFIDPLTLIPVVFDPTAASHTIKIPVGGSVTITAVPKYPELATVKINGTVYSPPAITLYDGIDIFPVTVNLSVILEQGKVTERTKNYTLQVYQDY